MRCPRGIFICVGMFLISSLAFGIGQSAGEKPLTKAEATDFKATSRYADVMDFIFRLQRFTPDLRVETLCVSAEGRAVPLIVIGRPVPALPGALHDEKRGIIYIQANIHAGEVEGKEASLMLPGTSSSWTTILISIS